MLCFLANWLFTYPFVNLPQSVPVSHFSVISVQIFEISCIPLDDVHCTNACDPLAHYCVQTIT